MESKFTDSSAMGSPLIQYRFAKFLENNENPPQPVVAKIRGLLLGPMQELRRKEGEIAGIEQALDALEAECEAQQNSTLEYELVRAPIHRLPPDILHEIFYHCLPTHRNPVMSYKEAPLLLTCICQSWKYAALSFPRLWARLHIPLYLPRIINNDTGWNAWGGFIPSGDEPNAEVEREAAEKTLRSRQKLAQIWLSRSGILPLSISLWYDGLNDPLDPEGSTEEHPIKQIFTTILSFSATIADLELSMPFDAYQIYLSDISPDTVPMLRRLRVNFRGRASLELDAGTVPVSLMQAPNLQSLSVRGRANPAFKGVFAVVGNLIDLSIHHHISSADAVKILRRFHQLRNCKLIISNNTGSPHSDSEDVLSLAQLQNLSLAVSVITEGMSEFYKQIHAPHLIRLQYRQYTQHGPRRAARSLLGESQPPTGLHHLLEKSSKLTKLSLDPSIIGLEDILLCLRSSSQVTHLVLGLQSKELNQPDEIPGRSDQWEINLNHLIFPTEFECGINSNDGQGINTVKEIFLPRLEVFEGLEMPNKTTDEEVKKFILGRLGASAERNGVSSLKRVKMAFERAQDMDVAADIQVIEKETGVKVQLEFQYAPPFLGARYSPGVPFDERSWGF